VVVAGSSDVVLGIDAMDGVVRWRRRATIGWWGGMLESAEWARPDATLASTRTERA